jgi:hypothetical protein
MESLVLVVLLLVVVEIVILLIVVVVKILLVVVVRQVNVILDLHPGFLNLHVWSSAIRRWRRNFADREILKVLLLIDKSSSSRYTSVDLK